MPDKQPKERADRLSSAAERPLTSDSLVGSFFHSDAGRGWQGCIVAEPMPGIYVAELFDWLVGASTHQELLRHEDMVGWQFYDDADWMRNAYDNGLKQQWERDRGEAP